MLIANFINLAGPDFIVIAMIIAVVAGLPVLIALPIAFYVSRRSKKPPPLPPSIDPQ